MEYSEPGTSEQTYTISGFHVPDEPGTMRIAHATPVPIHMRVRHEAAKRRSVAWWLSAWMPRAWRIALCNRYGHPASLIGNESTTQVVVTSARGASSEGEVTYDLEQFGDTFSMTRWCDRCGAVNI